jgi:hypothetical protein
MKAKKQPAASPAPKSPKKLNSDAQCTALTDIGQPCKRSVTQAGFQYCPPCHQDLRRLSEDYKSTEAEYERRKANQSGKKNKKKKLGSGDAEVHKVQSQIALLGRVLAGRDEVYNRFYSGSSDAGRNRGHSMWTLRLKGERRELEKRIDVLEAAKEASVGTSNAVKTGGKDRTPTSPAAAKQTILPVEGQGKASTTSKPKLATKIPSTPQSKGFSKALASLHAKDAAQNPAQLPAAFDPAHAMTTIRESLARMHGQLLQRLFAMVPSLRDDDEDVSDLADHVLRFVFREYVHCTNDEDTATRAAAAKSVHSFLMESSVDELKEDMDFFESLGVGQPRTWRFLRDGVTDALLSPGAAATVIMGGRVAKDRIDRRVTLEGWDVLHESFSDIVGGHNVESFCYHFEDVALVKGCIALNRYGNTRDEPDGWLDEERDIFQLCQEGVHLGFIGLTMGYSNQGTGIQPVGGVYVEGEFRNYFSGRIAKSNAFALPLIKELKSRVAELIVNTYDGPSAWPYRKKVMGVEHKPWIKRVRRSRSKDQVTKGPWEVNWSYENLLQDIDTAYTLRMETMTDFYQIVIMDRVPHRKNRLPQILCEALLDVSGYSSMADVLLHFTQFFPVHEQASHREAAADFRQVELSVPRSRNVRFDRQRQRAWEVDNDFIAKHLTQISSHTSTTSRVIKAMTTDMVAQGLLTALDEVPSELDVPVVIRGADGVEDVYLNYACQNTADVEQGLSAKGLTQVPLPSSLHDFAAQYAGRYRGAIFAKGRINVHYCAWPILSPKKWCFRTIEGHVFQWNVLPFDAPLSSRLWHQVLDERMHRRFPFVKFSHTSFVVCATSLEQAQYRIQQLKAEASMHGWTLKVPEPRFWTANYELLDLRDIWTGVMPEGSEREVQKKKEEGESVCRIM